MKKIFLSLILILCTLDLFSQFMTFSGIYDTQFDHIDRELEKFGFGKVTYYYDEINKKDGKWKLYPKILVSDSIFAVCISTIEGLENKYTFIIFYDSKLKQVQDTIGPFFDMFPNAIKFKNGKLPQVTIKLRNPPEPYEPKFTFIEYVRNNSRFIKLKSYNKY